MTVLTESPGDGDGPASDSYATDCTSQPENPDCLDLDYPTTSVATGVPIRPDVDCSDNFYVPRIECLPPESSTTTVPDTTTTLPETGIDPLGPTIIGIILIAFGLLMLVAAARRRLRHG